MNELVVKLTNNQEFVEKVSKCQNATEFADLLVEYDIGLEGLNPEEAYAQYKSGFGDSKNSDEELNEADLLAVSGGAIKGLFYWIGYGIGKLFAKKTGVCVYD